MKQKLFLTSALAMGVIAPAMAEPTNTGTFPSNGLMQEDYKYTEAATEANMGVYDGSVNAIAEYTEIPYSAEEGFYLTGVDNNNDAITAECTSGNFCPGVSSTTYENNAFVDTGLQSCSTATSGAYTLSDAGASSSGQCYRTCDGHVSILHATGVTGNDYSDGTNTCAPTGCENGWHIYSSTLKDVIDNQAPVNWSYITHKGYFSENDKNSSYISPSNPKGQAYYDITENDSFAVDFGNKGFVYGRGICSTQVGQGAYDYSTNTALEPTQSETLTGEDWVGTGSYRDAYCWCQITGYKPYGGTRQNVVSSYVSKGIVSYCDDGCAKNCAQNFYEYNGYIRNFILSSADYGPASCEANTININWYNADANDISANNAGTATYGSDVRTPVKAQTIKGKTFKGWRFSKPEQTNLSD